ncbi:MAG: YdbL family protein [Gammaproteobacteria bacterium]|nr:YdbL family protein [Gammaproteobacteria bacterium]
MVLTLCASLSFAADMDTAKEKGAIGERLDGYLGLVNTTAAADVAELVKNINQQRKAQYQRIAQTNNLSLDQVQTLAGTKTIKKTSPGNWIQTSEGWRKK